MSQALSGPVASPATSVKVPTAPRQVRCRNPKTGKWPRIKICGYALPPEDIHAWAAEKNILQDRTPINREYRALFMIFDRLPDDIQWAAVTPHGGEGAVSCIAIGSDKSVQDIKNAYNPARAKLVHAAMEKDLGPPQWYYFKEDFHHE